MIPDLRCAGVQLFSPVARRHSFGTFDRTSHRYNLLHVKSAQVSGAWSLLKGVLFAEQHGGRVLPSDLPLSYATHVVVQHQSQPACAEALQQRKTAVTSFWVLACAEVKHVLPCTHPVRRIVMLAISAAFFKTADQSKQPCTACHLQWTECYLHDCCRCCHFLLCHAGLTPAESCIAVLLPCILQCFIMATFAHGIPDLLAVY